MPITPEEAQALLNKIEIRIKQKMDFSRADVQDALNRLRRRGVTPEQKAQFIKAMVLRSGVKKIGIKTLYTPRSDFPPKEVDKTLDFLQDLYTYNGVNE